MFKKSIIHVTELVLLSVLNISAPYLSSRFLFSFHLIVKEPSALFGTILGGVETIIEIKTVAND